MPGGVRPIHWAPGVMGTRCQAPLAPRSGTSGTEIKRPRHDGVSTTVSSNSSGGFCVKASVSETSGTGGSGSTFRYASVSGMPRCQRPLARGAGVTRGSRCQRLKGFGVINASVSECFGIRDLWHLQIGFQCSTRRTNANGNTRSLARSLCPQRPSFGRTAALPGQATSQTGAASNLVDSFGMAHLRSVAREDSSRCDVAIEGQRTKAKCNRVVGYV